MKRTTIFATLMLISAIVFGQMTFEKKTISIPVKDRELRNLANKAIIWQNDFSNPSEWTMEWMQGNPNDGPWVIGTTGPSGYYSAGMGPINSTTAANGFAMYDSDGIGVEPGEQDSKIIYNGTINCSGHPKVAVMFESYYRKFHGTPYLEVSNNGTTWTSFELHTNLNVNQSSANPTIVTVNITAVAGNQPNVYLRFRYHGEWDYAWMVDDIVIFDAPDYDVELQQVRLNFWPDYANYGYSGFYGQIPLEQLSVGGLPIWFGGVIKNLGSQSVTPKLDVTVTNPANSQIFSQTYNMPNPLATEGFDTIKPNYQDVNTAFVWTNPQIGEYKFNFLAGIIGQNDENPVNNTKNYSVFVTHNDFAHDNGNYTGQWSTCNYQGGCVDGDIIGVEYKFFQTTKINHLSFWVGSMSTVGSSYIAKIMFWDEGGNTWSELSSSDFITIENSNQVGTWHNVTFLDEVFVNVEQGGETNILAAIEYYPGSGGHFRLGIDGSAPTNGFETWMYFAGEGQWYYYGGTHVPLIRLNVGEPSNVAIQNAGSVSVYPNPSNGIISVANVENANIEVINMMGQVVKSVKSEYEISSIDLSNFSNGTYFVRVIKGNEVSTLKINLVK